MYNYNLHGYSKIKIMIDKMQSNNIQILPSKSTNEVNLTTYDLHPEYNVPDKFRNGLEASQIHKESKHPLQERLSGWHENQMMMKLKLERNVYGLGTPLRKMMERKICSVDNSMPAFNESYKCNNLQLDVLEGKDDILTFDDVHNCE